MARPGRHCPVCDADLLVRTQIETLRESNHSYREINSLVPGFDVHKIRRHFKHVGKAAAEVTKLSAVEKSELRLTELANRAEESWIAAAASGDSRAALEVLKASIRLELDRHARLLEKQEKQATDDSSDPEKSGAPSVEWLDMTVRKVRAFRVRHLQNGFILCPICEKYPVLPETVFANIKTYEESRNGSQPENPN